MFLLSFRGLENRARLGLLGAFGKPPGRPGDVTRRPGFGMVHLLFLVSGGRAPGRRIDGSLRRGESSHLKLVLDPFSIPAFQCD